MTVGYIRKNRERAAHLGPEKRRPQVLDAALTLAVKDGIRGVSMEAVAAQLGVTKPVVYACFASRDELLSALLEREEQKLFTGVMSALPASPNYLDPERLMIEGFQALLKVVKEHADSWQLVFTAEPDAAVAERYGLARQMVTRRVSKLMEPGLRLRGVTDVPRKLPVLVEMFMSMSDGAVRSLIRGDGGWSPDELGAIVGRAVYGALKKA